MTMLILDPRGRLRDNDVRQLRAGGAELIVLTGDAGGHRTAGGPDELRVVADYRHPGALEYAVLDLAATRQISVIVAIDDADQVRAAALRDYLGLLGQDRASALTLQDLSSLRAWLAEAGVPTVPCGTVRSACDVFRHAQRFGYPIRIRERRLPGWPTVAVLRGEADAAAFTAIPAASGAASGTWPYVAEPALDGDHVTVTAEASDRDGWVLAGGTVDARRLADDALVTLPTYPESTFTVDVVVTGGGEHFIDSVRAKGAWQ